MALNVLYRGVASGNTQFARDVAAWTFQESLVLRIDKTEHHRLNETEPQELYTTNDQLVNSIFSFQPCVICIDNIFRSTASISRNIMRRKVLGSLTQA